MVWGWNLVEVKDVLIKTERRVQSGSQCMVEGVIQSKVRLRWRERGGGRGVQLWNIGSRGDEVNV